MAPPASCRSDGILRLANATTAAIAAVVTTASSAASATIPASVATPKRRLAVAIAVAVAVAPAAAAAWGCTRSAARLARLRSGRSGVHLCSVTDFHFATESEQAEDMGSTEAHPFIRVVCIGCSVLKS
jgi:hypothetical protein